MRKLSLSIEQWNTICKTGIHSTVQIPLHGISMQPWIRMDQDIVTVAPLVREIQKGDVILFHRLDGAWVVHRVLTCMEDQLQTIGDGCLWPDAPIRTEDVYGLITEVRRGNWTISLDTSLWRRIGIIWMWLLPVRRANVRIKRALKNLGRKIMCYAPKKKRN